MLTDGQQLDQGQPDLLSDPENCGAPGALCPTGTRCHFGVCVPLSDPDPDAYALAFTTPSGGSW